MEPTADAASAASATPVGDGAAPRMAEPRLDPGCRTQVLGISDFVEGAEGDPASPLEQARRYRDRWHEGGEATVASEGGASTYVTVTDAEGRVVAVLQYVRLGHGWSLAQQRACTDPAPPD